MIRELATNNWITFLFVFLLAILVVINYLFPIKFLEFSSFFKKEQFYTKYSKTFVVLEVFFLLVTFFSILLYSFILYKLLLYYKNEVYYNSFFFYLRLVGVTFGYVLIRYFLGKFINNFFKDKKFQEHILFYKWLFLSKMGFYIFPLVIVFHYYNLTYFYLVLAVIMAIILVYNYFVLLLKNQKYIFKHLFYFILYLCTLEIAPLIVYLKIVLKV